ncbi:MAG: prepilin-type N-terminal cleavage/methylation domain-containing protein [Gemmatimonadales bacterium]|nr:prepilin-type N-terminal cleavage/methylation domain-containing protein [Gemmatimonadales bacterium]
MQLDRAGRGGFSMMELMVVIVMLGIMASMAISRINVTKLKVNSEARNMASTLTYAQRLAISLQSDVRVAFDVPNNRITILEDRNNNGIADAGERARVIALESGVIFGRASAPAIPAIGGGPVSFTRTLGGLPAAIFHRDGSSAEAGGFYLTSARSVAASLMLESRAIDITRATSRVTRYSYASNTAWKTEN